MNIYFVVLRPVARTLSRSVEEPPLATTMRGVYLIFYILLPLRVSALGGHLQAEYSAGIYKHLEELTRGTVRPITYIS
jgi:hypothetical protein